MNIFEVTKKQKVLALYILLALLAFITSIYFATAADRVSAATTVDVSETMQAVHVEPGTIITCGSGITLSSVNVYYANRTSEILSPDSESGNYIVPFGESTGYTVKFEGFGGFGGITIVEDGVTMNVLQPNQENSSLDLTKVDISYSKSLDGPFTETLTDVLFTDTVAVKISPKTGNQFLGYPNVQVSASSEYAAYSSGNDRVILFKNVAPGGIGTWSADLGVTIQNGALGNPAEFTVEPSITVDQDGYIHLNCGSFYKGAGNGTITGYQYFFAYSYVTPETDEYGNTTYVSTAKMAPFMTVAPFAENDPSCSVLDSPNEEIVSAKPLSYYQQEAENAGGILYAMLLNYFPKQGDGIVGGAYMTYTVDSDFNPVTSTGVTERLEYYTDEEIQMINNGAPHSVELEVGTSSSAATADSRASIHNAAPEYVVGSYMDILFKKKVGEKESNITETSNPVEVKLLIPRSISAKPSDMARVYKVARVHDGVTDILDASYDSTTGELIFETDKFSTYAILYDDNQVAPPIEPVIEPEVTICDPADHVAGDVWLYDHELSREGYKLRHKDCIKCGASMCYEVVNDATENSSSTVTAQNSANTVVSSSTTTYTVQKGECLSTIARKHNIAINDILALNTFITNPSLIYPGDVLVLSVGAANVVADAQQNIYTVVAGDCLSSIARKLNTTVAKLIEANDYITNPSLIYPGNAIKFNTK